MDIKYIPTRYSMNDKSFRLWALSLRHRFCLYVIVAFFTHFDEF